MNLGKVIDVLEPISRIAHPGFSVSRPLLLYEDIYKRRGPLLPGKPVVIFRVTCLTPYSAALYVSSQVEICEEEVLENTPEQMLNLAKSRIKNAIILSQEFAAAKAKRS